MFTADSGTTGAVILEAPNYETHCRGLLVINPDLTEGLTIKYNTNRQILETNLNSFEAFIGENIGWGRRNRNFILN